MKLLKLLAFACSAGALAFGIDSAIHHDDISIPAILTAMVVMLWAIWATLEGK